MHITKYTEPMAIFIPINYVTRLVPVVAAVPLHCMQRQLQVVKFTFNTATAPSAVIINNNGSSTVIISIDACVGSIFTVITSSTTTTRNTSSSLSTSRTTIPAALALCTARKNVVYTSPPFLTPAFSVTSSMHTQPSRANIGRYHQHQL